MSRNHVNDLNEAVKYLHEIEQPYTALIGNYTAVLKVNGKSKMFSSDTSNRSKALAMCKKLKSEIEPVLHHFEDFNINSSDINYYEINDRLNHCREATNIDISAAYPNALINTGSITDVTANKLLNTLSKTDRLVSMGTLAYEPIVLEFNGKEMSDLKVRENPFRPVFFYCAKTISDLMHEIKEEILKEDFIMYWVDGIYFNKNPKKAEEIKDFLFKRSYLSTIDELTDFKSEFTGNGYNFEYLKNKKTKTIHIPAFSNQKKIRKKLAVSRYCFDKTEKNFRSLIDKFYN